MQQQADLHIYTLRLHAYIQSIERYFIPTTSLLRNWHTLAGQSSHGMTVHSKHLATRIHFNLMLHRRRLPRILGLENLGELLK